MENKKNMGRELFEWIIMIVIAIALAFFIKTFVFSTTIVSGASMEPTLKTDDKLFVNRVPFLVDQVKKGDIIEFKNPTPDDKKEDFIKRVIGLEGDTVEIIDNKVYVNGEQLEEDYTSSNGETFPQNESKWVVGENQIFVLGDNRPRSNDSRSFGTIPKDSVVGIAFFRFLPFSKIGGL